MEFYCENSCHLTWSILVFLFNAWSKFWTYHFDVSQLCIYRFIYYHTNIILGFYRIIRRVRGPQMNSLISLKYIHWFELDLKKGYRLNAAGVKHNLIVRNMTGLVAEKTPKQRTVFPEHWISIKYHRLSTPSRWMIRLHQDFKKGRDRFL